MQAALVTACLSTNRWKGLSLLRYAALILARDHPAAARVLVASMPEGRFRRNAERRVAAGETFTPREFFW